MDQPLRNCSEIRPKKKLIFTIEAIEVNWISDRIRFNPSQALRQEEDCEIKSSIIVHYSVDRRRILLFAKRNTDNDSLARAAPQMDNLCLQAELNPAANHPIRSVKMMRAEKSH